MDDVESGFLVNGSSIAALRAAIKLAEVGEVLILKKAGSREGITVYAQG